MESLSLLDRNDLNQILEEVIRRVIQDELNNTNAHKDAASPLLTREEVAKMLDVSLPTLLSWEKDGTIPSPKRLGKRVYFIRKDFIHFLESK